MSKFKTSIAVDVAAVKELLPEGSFLHGVNWDAKHGTVDLLWEHEKILTGRDFPVEFPAAVLHGQQQLPEGIRVLPGVKPAAKPAATEVTKATEATEEVSHPVPLPEGLHLTPDTSHLTPSAPPPVPTEAAKTVAAKPKRK